MVWLNRIYTKTGDDGATSLGTGERRLKCDLRIEACGDVDEANAAIGITRLFAQKEDQAVDDMLARIQNDLFDLGADLTTPQSQDCETATPALRIAPIQVERLEAEIDLMNAELNPLKSFVLPGGTPAAAYLHLARTSCRRAERTMVALAHKNGEAISKPALRYINRLSDHLFVASRYLNRRGNDVLWVPGQNR